MTHKSFAVGMRNAILRNHLSIATLYSVITTLYSVINGHTLGFHSDFAKTYHKFMIPIYELMRGNLGTIFDLN